MEWGAEASVELILSDPVSTVECMNEHPMAALTSQVTQLLDAAGHIPVTGLAGPEVDSVLGDTFTVMSRMAMHLTAVVE